MQDVAFLHQIPEDRDRAQFVQVVRAAARTLVRVKLDDRMIQDAIAVQIAIGDRLDVGRVAFDHDLVALGHRVVEDRVMPDAVDPVVMQIVVLARHAVPPDRAIVLRMLFDELLFRVDQRLEVEDVCARPPFEDIIARNRLIRIKLAIRQLPIGVALVPAGDVGDLGLARVGPTDQPVIAPAARQVVLARATIENVVVCPAIELVVAPAALKDVIAAPAVDLVVAATAIDAVGFPRAANPLADPAALDQVQRHQRRAVVADAIGHGRLHQPVRPVVHLLQHRRQIIQRQRPVRRRDARKLRDLRFRKRPAKYGNVRYRAVHD